ncbi:AAA family ATPase [Facklamia lactis]|uniref:AAA family ATPase n=1 Tax=Facklamia lactis TaxID=2749967 RepID=UPI0018CECD8B|nr:AAA family ATPase [Facklamia lactis]MBG9981031.1 AAA family ATPase [Facklamia lactis]
MKKIDIDLNKQQYPVFDLTDNNNLEIGAVNFIFGKNGTGKSTLSNIIRNQYGDDPNYSVHIYTGMEDLLVENKLNTIVLGEENKEVKIKVEKIDKELQEKNGWLKSLQVKLKSLEWKKEYRELGIEEHELFKKTEESEIQFNQQTQKMEDFYRYAAKQIREFDSKIKLTLQKYDKNNFKIEINNGFELSESNVEDYKKRLLEDSKEKIALYKIFKHDYEKLYEEVNSILSQQPKQLNRLHLIGQVP